MISDRGRVISHRDEPVTPNTMAQIRHWQRQGSLRTRSSWASREQLGKCKRKVLLENALIISYKSSTRLPMDPAPGELP